MRSVSSDAEFSRDDEPPRQHSRSAEDLARDFAKKDGGRWQDYVEQAEQILKKPRDGTPYDDSALVSAGFKRVEIYPYVGPNGGLLYQSLRYEHPGVPGAKQFRQRRKGPKGNWLADAGLVKVPYQWDQIVACPNVPLHYVEGEKDAKRLTALGLLATTMAGQQWSPEAAKAFKGRDVAIIGDCDEKGRENVAKAVSALRGFAASLRVVELPGLSRTQDVSDWLDAGHTKDELLKLIENARPCGIRLAPAPFLDPRKIPVRRWLYRPHYIRQFVSLLVSTGGIGKSSLAIVEALALATGEPLLGVTPEGPLSAWYWNGEDPIDELNRRFAAAIQRYQLSREEIGSRLFISSGRDMPIVVAEEDKKTARLNQTMVDEVIDNIRRNKIDVVIIDPFVSTHHVSENDNGAIDMVAKAWNQIAEVTNCAVLLVHHSRKPKDGELAVDDARGASALLAAARSARIINTMTKDEAKLAEIDERERRTYFASYNGKSNLAKPAADREWYRLVSVDLENGRDLSSDHVGVVTPWQFPKVDMSMPSPGEAELICKRITAGGPWRAAATSRKEPWIGRAVADALKLDRDREKDKKRVRAIVNEWLSTGRLVEVLRNDKNGDPRPYIELGEPTAPAASRETMDDDEPAEE